MRHSVSLSCRRPLVLALVLFGLLASGTARAQGPEEGMDALTEKYNKTYKKIEEYFKSQAALDTNDAQIKDAVDVAAMWVTYRLHTEIWIPLREPGMINKVIGEFERYVKYLQGNKENPELAKLFAQRVIVHALEVMNAKQPAAKPITQVNAARILAGLAVLRPNELADSLLLLLKDPKMNDGVKYWCLRGLRNLLALPVIPNTPPVVSKDQMAKIVPFLIDFVQRDPSLPAAPTIEEVDGFRLLRREAVRALAQVHTPVLGDKVLPALTLLRFVARDTSLRLEPRLDERLEAAIGLAQMESKSAPDYQPAYAAYYIGLFVRDFVLAADSNIEARRSNRWRPWSVDASRLIEALESMQKLNPRDKKVQAVINICVLPLKNLEQNKPSTGPQRSALNTLDNDPPSEKELFKDRAGTAVKPPQQDPSK